MFRREFSLADQLAFAQLSGDNNPIHVDPLYARRSMLGQAVVHGIHSLMWVLDRYLETRLEAVRIKSLQVAFSKPIGLHQEVRFVRSTGSTGRIRLDLLKGEEVVLRMAFELEPAAPGNASGLYPGPPLQQSPEPLGAAQLAIAAGRLDLHLPADLLRRMFPQLARCLCPVQTATLLATTRLVGVICPGLHSIYSELKLAAQPAGGAVQLSYQVMEYTPHYGQVLMAIAAPGLAGTIKSFLRPEPKRQPSFAELKQLVPADVFAGQRALVVGGSRGLGEVAAKMLAAGGAEVWLTYRAGKADAGRVVEEIRGGGGQAALCELDILQPMPDWSSRPAPTALYFFATPHITSNPGKGFSAQLYRDFCDYYVVGLARLVEALQPHGLKTVYYPSSVFVEELPGGFIEYAMAKNAGELLCRALGKKYPETHFYCHRLPKLATDQTVSLQPWSIPEAPPVILATLLASQPAVEKKFATGTPAAEA